MMKKLGSLAVMLPLLFDFLLAQSLFGPDVQFRHVGPSRGGRVTTVTGVLDRPGTFYMGATGGGVWKTEDYGANWKNVSDGYFATGSIGSMAVDPQLPDHILVGTGSDGIRSNVIVGKGVYFSPDAGATWQHVGLKDAGQIGAALIDPRDTNTFFIAAIGNPFRPNGTRGVFRSRDAGKTWENVLFHSDSVGAVDLEFAPGNPDIVYAAMWYVRRKPWDIVSGGKEGGIYRSTDGGTTWTKMTQGLPSGLIGKIDFAVSGSMPERVWALVEAPEGEGGVYRSDDYGVSWTLVSTNEDILDRPFYYCNLQVNPKNPNSLYAMATSFWHSADGAKSWKRTAAPHGDHHDLWINPKDTLVWIECNDGGANITRDGGKTWSTQDNQPTAELYQVEIDDDFPYNLYAGQQDNTTIMVPSLPPRTPTFSPTSFWMATGGCETGPAVPKPGDPNIVYANCKGRFGVYNKTTGQEQQYYVGAANIYGHNPRDLDYRFQRVSPIHVSPFDPNIVYHGSQYLHRTTDGGKTWETISPDLTAFTPETQVISGTPITRDVTGEEFYSTLYAIRESPLERGVIWTGSNDGPFYLTRNGGRDWINVTPEDLASGGRVQNIEASPHHPGKAYYAVYRYLLGDFQPYIYRTTDYGKSWTRLTSGTNGIDRDDPVHVVREDPVQEGLLFAGTDKGLYISYDDGANWQSFQQNLPVTPYTDLKIHQGDLVLSTMGRGFWILDDMAFTRQGVAQDKNMLYTPQDAYRMRYWARGGDVPVDYKENGVIVDYVLVDTSQDALHMEIHQGSEVYKTWTVKPGNQEKNSDQYRLANQPVYTPGHHRFLWNMQPDRASRGALVPPGRYTITMKLGDQVVDRDFYINLDPRVEAAGITESDLVEQFRLYKKIQQLQQDVSKLKSRIDKEQAMWKPEELKGKKKVEAQLKLDALHTALSELVTAEGRYQTPKLLDQIRYLASMISSADQLPGQDAYQRYDQLERWYQEIKSSIDFHS
ncbi:MAG: hypothetical protein KDC57_19175 [Saprospiraceae bacterium]|nr:hypothetical protein [Saprospiraceae bacterium]